jgi:hypothetical protein
MLLARLLLLTNFLLLLSLMFLSCELLQLALLLPM